MATDFFERQSQARRSTKWLVVMFLLAVVGIVGSVFAVTTLAVGTWEENIQQQFDGETDQAAKWSFPIGASLCALVLIAGGSWYKIAQLGGGGTVVAENVGGRRIIANTDDPVEKRVLNVVEEMALAAGVPVPPVYMLPEEKGINAFAAGYSPSDAVVAVTRGTAEGLSRDELQGVVAHEFSHILNGDMRLNIRLIGILHGILLLSLIGRILFRIAGSSRSDSKNNPALYFVLIGLALLILGLVGSVMGNLIKAAVSRQREYLADASAVQFTRNPTGIAGALKAIGAALVGSRLQHPNAAEMSHMYFGQGVWEGFTGLMATHPPLAKRILRIEPNWDGKFPAPPDTSVVAAEMQGAAGFVGSALRADEVPVDVVENAADQIGNPTEGHRHYVQELVARLPKKIVEAVHEPYGARAVIFALLLDRDDKSVRRNQLKKLAESTTPDIVALTEKLSPVVDRLDARVRLPLVDMALPGLRAMVDAQYVEFSRAFQELVRADNRLGLFEWTLHRILLRHLRPQFENAAAPRIAYYGLQRLAEPCSVLLSTLAYAGHDLQQARKAIAEAAGHLPDVKIELLPSGECGLANLDRALNQLAKVAAKHRERLIDACAAAICADEEVKIREAELLRGISDMLDCPMPPLLPGQTVRRRPAS